MFKNLADATSPPPDNAVLPPALWHLHQIPTWQRDAHSRCPILLCPTCSPCNTSQHLCEPSPHHTTEEDWCPGCCVQWPNPLCPSRDDPLGLARRYMWCSHGPSPIPPCPWCPYSGRWHHPMWWSSCCPSLQKGTKCYTLSMKATKEYPNANTIPTNVFIGLGSIETSNMSLKHVLHASAITHRSLNSHSSQPQCLNAHGNTLVLTSHALQWQWVPHHHWLLLKDALCP